MQAALQPQMYMYFIPYFFRSTLMACRRERVVMWIYTICIKSDAGGGETQGLVVNE